MMDVQGTAALASVTEQPRPLMYLDSEELGRITLRERTTIGRARDHTVILDDPAISRDHLAIEWDAASSAYRATDLDSTSGTLLNGASLPPYDPRPMQAGDMLEIVGHSF
jgi:pSer/pThr/pTyr-binding forkhead associated (FHA) protein